MTTFTLTPEQIGKCHCCEKPFRTNGRHATDLCVYFTRDEVPTLAYGFLCKVCRERYFEIGAFTLPIPVELGRRKLQ
jgi:hypothetical protein